MKIEPSLHPFGEVCREIDFFPNATVAEYGVIRLEDNNNDVATVMTMIQAEIWARGPVAASVHGAALHHYRGGVFDDESAPRNTTHCVSIVGWGVHYDEKDTKQEIPLTHWIVRNSWGQYFGGKKRGGIEYCSYSSL
jgi:cathepsin X